MSNNELAAQVFTTWPVAIGYSDAIVVTAPFMIHSSTS
jgi:hypothetical protein